jgi:hypothetical protein
MYFFLPEEFVAPCPTLRKLPRSPHKILYTPEWFEVINSLQFVNEVGDAFAALAFLHFKVRGWKEDYTGYSPFWKLSYSLPIWAEQIKIIANWNWKKLLRVPPKMDLDYFPSDYVHDVMELAVTRAIADKGWQEIIDTAKKMPCHEDFEFRQSRVRIDFLRKWNHTRTKLKSVSLQTELEDSESRIHKIGDENNVYHFAYRVETEDFIAQFKKRLNARDCAIFELRLQEYTFAEIAEKLGYSNHSGVVKRMKVIQQAYREYDKL